LNSHTRLKILFLSLEFPHWSIARSTGYSIQLGLEEGFRFNDVDFFTITTQWFPIARQICNGKRFDQIWVEIVHNNSDDRFWDWLTTLAPVRVGLMSESLKYTPQELDANPGLRGRDERVQDRFKYITHILAVDEMDVEAIKKSDNNLSVLWWPGTIPNRFIVEEISPISKNYAVFSGTAYRLRAKILQSPNLQGLLVHQVAPDRHTVPCALFDAMQIVAPFLSRLQLPGVEVTIPAYLATLRYIRRHNFALYLRSLKAYSAIVNLPSYVKAYPGRVQEGMAVGRPVISVEITDRPRNKNLFKDGQEILLYSASEPEQLAEQIRRVLSDPNLANRIATNALQKLKFFHTTEKRVSQVLEWIESGNEPDYE